MDPWLAFLGGVVVGGCFVAVLLWRRVLEAEYGAWLATAQLEGKLGRGGASRS
jgi:hypothetical protein